MKNLASAAAVLVILFTYGGAHAKSYDAAEEYVCDPGTSQVWSYEGYRADDGAYLPMSFGRVQIEEVTKYGIEAHYIPDSGQIFYPFMLRFPDGIWASPATEGKRFDAVLTWTAPENASARFSGFVSLKGDITAGEAGEAGRKITARLVRGSDELWSSEVAGGKKVEFDVTTSVSAGDRLHLHLVNAGDRSGNLAVFNMKVDTTPR